MCYDERDGGMEGGVKRELVGIKRDWVRAAEVDMKKNCMFKW